MKIMLRIIFLIALANISAFAMHSAEININDKDVELAVKIDIAEYNYSLDPDTTFIGFSYLKGTQENSKDEHGTHVDTNGYYEASFLMKKRMTNDILVGIGIKLNYTEINDESYISAPLGLEAGYTLSTGIPITLGAKLYYAPQSLAFSKADNFLEYRIEAIVDIIDGGSIILGYRNLDTNFKIDAKSYDVTYNESAYIGFRFSF